MRKILLTVFVLFFLFNSCRNKEKKVDVYSIEKMSAVLDDILMAEKKVLHSSIRLDTAIAYYQYEMWPKICSKHHVNPEKFELSFLYYVSQIDKNGELKDIFQMSADSLEKRAQVMVPVDSAKAVQ